MTLCQWENSCNFWLGFPIGRWNLPVYFLKTPRVSKETCKVARVSQLQLSLYTFPHIALLIFLVADRCWYRCAGISIIGKMWVPLGEYPNCVRHHVPTLYGVYKAIWVNV